ncbi:hypothetical protein NPS29_10640 [Pseudomonas putida]|jgi:hypothetical protein|uniref:hypothetical protein n=1 Tax=Pseudomonas putida TaxID=303 RepID=UPI002363D932|nr:hypothetical protein [Pseudomonas putida]MDD1965776.1 hypothetical protein [Pseudomonas putida]
MISKMTQALVLTGTLIAAGAANASDRNVIVPVIAGAAIGAVVATVASNSHHHHRPARYYAPPPPPPRYVPRYQPVYYAPPPPVVYRRFEPPRPHGYYDGGWRRGHDRGWDHRRDGRW